MLDWMTSPEAWVALATLTALEIVLGIDNIIFISILVGRLRQDQRASARKAGLGLAMIARLGLLFSISWVMGLTDPWFTILNQRISGRDVVLIMAIAIVLAVVVMLMAARAIGDFVDEHPTIKMLALSFLILVGVTLMAEGFDVHVPKGYIYFAMAFSIAVEMLNIRMRKLRTAPVRLHKPLRDADGG